MAIEAVPHAACSPSSENDSGGGSTSLDARATRSASVTCFRRSASALNLTKTLSSDAGSRGRSELGQARPQSVAPGVLA